MLHIILGILKILGILLLVILALVVVILLLALFVPVRYRLQAQMYEKIHAKGTVSWFLHLFYVRVEYRDKELEYAVKLLGHTLIGSGESEKEELEKEEEPQEVGKAIPQEDTSHKDISAAFIDEETVREEVKIPETMAEEEETVRNWEHEDISSPKLKIVDETIDDEPKEAKGIFGTAARLWESMKRFWAGIVHAFRNIRETVSNIKKRVRQYTDFWHNAKTQAAYRHVKKEAGYLLRHIRPRKLEGQLLFGTEDPAGTGEILGVLCVLQGFSGNRLQVNADFERKVLEGEVSLAGHVRGCHFVKAFLGLLIDKNVRITIKRFLRMKKE